MKTSKLSKMLAPVGLGDSKSAKDLLADKQGLSASLPEVLGAIAIGIVVLGLAGFGIGAGVNYSQDSGAKQVLESVKSAQVLHQSKTGGFGSLEELTTATGGATPALTVKPDNIALATTADKRNYCAVIESGSMGHTKFWITSASGKILETAPAAGSLPTGLTCPTPPAP